MLKKEAKAIYLQKRKTLTAKQVAVFTDLILVQFQKLTLPPLQSVLAYLAMEHHHEIATDAIVDYLVFRNPGLQIAYPVCDFDTNTMEAMLTNEDTVFAQNKFNTWEPQSSTMISPQEIDLVIVPLVCFDKQGYRVGYGKGFYDKFLHQVTDETITVGLSFYEAIAKIDDTHQFDVPLKYCVTPEKIYEF